LQIDFMCSSKLKHLSKITPRLRAEDDGTTVTLPIWRDSKEGNCM